MKIKDGPSRSFNILNEYENIDSIFFYIKIKAKKLEDVTTSCWRKNRVGWMLQCLHSPTRRPSMYGMNRLIVYCLGTCMLVQL